MAAPTMNLRRIKIRITVLNIMLAIAIFSITLGICRPQTELWPTYLATAWFTIPASSHGPATHDALAQEFTCPDVIRAALANPNIADLPRIKTAADPRRELLSRMVVEVHPIDQPRNPPAFESIKVVIAGPSESEAVLVRDALNSAYLKYRMPDVTGILLPGPQRVPHPIFDSAWEFWAATGLGLLVTVLVLVVPIPRSKRFPWYAAIVSSLLILFAAALLWHLTNPDALKSLERLLLL